MTTDIKEKPELLQQKLSDDIMSGHDIETSAHFNILTFVVTAGFRIITALFSVMGLIFIFSNSYWVPEGNVAVQSRLGALSDVESVVKTPGGPYFALPFPVDKVFKLPTTIQNVAIDKAFFLDGGSGTANDKKLLKADLFKPGVQGFLITGDKNIVQGTWMIHFRINFSPGEHQDNRNVVNFVKNIGTINRANEIIRLLAEEAIIGVVAGMTVSDFIAGRIDHETAKVKIQRQADSLMSGLSIVSISASHYGAPAVLEGDFQAATQAESEKALQIEKAMRYRTTTLSETAGERWEELLGAIMSYEAATISNNVTKQKNAFNDVETILLSDQLGGAVGSQLEKARTEKTSTIEKARSSVSRYSELLVAYKRDPYILKNQLFQDAFREVLMGAYVKVRWLPPGQRLYISDSENSRQE